ncbi:ABC transporter ATP-binding protein [Rhodococcus sp. 1R11]|uniref:ABC transporter ATP-binding protein n=1 Tax=Rhodococcus sp. 1R11 TaxID=2559614 RepID=UPI001071AC9C|nr:ABC transporter ATP-binding protein [Rhodococcus sp. 1R11]TFI42477.1 ABC transporter ATP-binding protein [Rhodococcus sp. 1R11]
MENSQRDSKSHNATQQSVSIDISHLIKEFRGSNGTVRAIDDVDIDVHAGEFVCIVGPSGCGKTSLLNIVAGLEDPSSGSVTVNTRSDAKTKRAVVFQEQGIFPWMTVLENAAFGLEARGVPEAERQEVARLYLKKMGLARFEKSYPHELSGGMKQRVNLARAFATDAEILLMDEPFAALDEQTKLLLQESLLQIWEGTSKTVLFITHSLDEAIRLADRVLIMTARPGRIKASIPVALPRPRNVLEMQSDPEFLKLHGTIWSQLRDEVLAARGDDPVAAQPASDSNSNLPIGTV